MTSIFLINRRWTLVNVDLSTYPSGSKINKVYVSSLFERTISGNHVTFSLSPSWYLSRRVISLYCSLFCWPSLYQTLRQQAALIEPIELSLVTPVPLTSFDIVTCRGVFGANKALVLKGLVPRMNAPDRHSCTCKHMWWSDCLCKWKYWNKEKGRGTSQESLCFLTNRSLLSSHSGSRALVVTFNEKISCKESICVCIDKQKSSKISKTNTQNDDNEIVGSTAAIPARNATRSQGLCFIGKTAGFAHVWSNSSVQSRESCVQSTTHRT